MRIMVTGAGGQLGLDVCRRLSATRLEYYGVDVKDFDITQQEAVMKAVTDYRPDAIIHCAAYTAVDRAETEPEKCMDINAQGSMNLVRAALAVDAKLMYISTDYVFSGEGNTPFEVDAPYGPTNVYGLSKAQGEEAVRAMMRKYFILRASWVFGHFGKNFVDTMLQKGRENNSLRVVSDQVGSPTYTVDLVELMLEMIQSDRYGVYHATNEGFCSWADFADEIMRQANIPCRIERVSSESYAALAKRPKNSRLSKNSLDEAGFRRLPTWQDALKRYLASSERMIARG